MIVGVHLRPLQSPAASFTALNHPVMRLVGPGGNYVWPAISRFVPKNLRQEPTVIVAVIRDPLRLTGLGT